MIKKAKVFYVMSGFVFTMVLVVIVCLTLVFTGVVTMPREIIKVRSSDATKVYDGQPLMAEGGEILEGQLAEGHTLVIIALGKQTEVGESDNHFSVVIKDSDGNNVTSDYQIVKLCGRLAVYE